MFTSELKALIQLSARIGSDLNLVQAGGGNTSIKGDDALWIKASGKWLVHAAHDDMFVPVPFSDIRRSLSSGDEKFPEYSNSSGAMLRPSVETTMHAVLPHRVIVHVHSVAAISWAAQAGGENSLNDRLSGLRWSWIPYIHPGVPLALRIQQDLAKHPDVLVLGNHGLVVGAEDCESAVALLREVESRLASNPRPAAEARFAALEQLVQDAGRDCMWKPAEDSEVHALATDPHSAAIASGGTMYPDHCVYLGPAAPIARSGESLHSALDCYKALYDYEPAFLLVEGAGVLTSSQLSRAGRELLLCLKRVVERIPFRAPIHYLEDWQVAKLMNWDAEKYRIAMARLEK